MSVSLFWARLARTEFSTCLDLGISAHVAATIATPAAPLHQSAMPGATQAAAFRALGILAMGIGQAIKRGAVFRHGWLDTLTGISGHPFSSRIPNFGECGRIKDRGIVQAGPLGNPMHLIRGVVFLSEDQSSRTMRLGGRIDLDRIAIPIEFGIIVLDRLVASKG